MAVNPDAVCTEEACCICFESPIREPTRTKCNHWFCWYAPQLLECALLVKKPRDTLFDNGVVSFPVSMFNGNALSSTAGVSAFTLCNSRCSVDSAGEHVCCYLFMRLDAALPCLGHTGMHKTHQKPQTASCLLWLPRRSIVYKEVLLLSVTADLAYRECIGTLLQGHTGAAASLVCPLCRAKVQGQELVKGVNEDAQALQEEDSLAASLEQKASTSESKLMALLEEVTACSVCLSLCLSSCLSDTLLACL